MVYDSYSVGQYLVDRLHELGVRHLFSVPGPYCAEWLHHYVEQSGSIRRIGHTNALNAGYAADGYARTNGVGAVCVPHSVGAYSLLNAVAGSFVERVPVIVINGAPPAEGADGGRRGRRRPLAGERDANRRVYADVTCAAERIAEPERAPQQIDRALRACLRARRPVFLEPTADVYDRPCPPPDGPLPIRTDRSAADHDGLLTDIAERLHAVESAVLWGGVELQRYDLSDEFGALVQALDVPYVTSLPGKGLLPEDHDHFAGVLDPSGTPPAVRDMVADVEYVLGLGVGPSHASPPDVVLERGAATLVHRDGVRAVPSPDAQPAVGSPAPDTPVCLRTLLFQLWTNVAGGLPSFEGAATAAQTRAAADSARPAPSTSPGADITYQGFYDLVAEYVEPDTLVMNGVGLDRLGGATLPVRGPSGFICQAAYGDVGYVAPAAIGAGLGTEAERVLVLVGDGGFQMTASCVGTMAEKGLDPIIFVLNNGVYGAEQHRTAPAAFEHEEAFFPQALLQHWHYRKLPDAMGGKGWRVETYGQLRSAVEEARKYTGGPLLIDVRLRQRSLPALAPQLEVSERPVDYTVEPALPTSS